MTEEEVRKIVHQAVEETLTKLGVDHEEPLEMQRDFRWVRDFRTSSESMKNRGALLVLGIVIAGLCTAAWIGFKSMIAGGQ